MQHVEFDAARNAVHFDRPGIEFNLGSIGKGYALDRAAEVITAAGVTRFLLHGGNSSIVARGQWQIGLRHPLKPQQPLGEIKLEDCALGTSGSGTQFFLHDGRRYGHILDPRSGRPAEGMLSVTVAATSGAEADALATAFYVLGVDDAIGYCRNHPGISAVLIAPAASSRIDVTLWGFQRGDIGILEDDAVRVRRAD